MIKFISRTKIRNSTEEAPFGIPWASTGPNNYLRVNPIIEREIGFLLEIDRYSCGLVDPVL